MSNILTSLTKSNDKFGFKTIFHIIAVFFLFILSYLIESIIVDSFYLLTKFEWKVAYVLVRSLLDIILFYFTLHLYIKKVLKVNLSYFRITKPNFSVLWIIIAILLPISVILYYFLFTDGTTYINNDELLLKIAYTLKFGLTAGINEEFLFRGYIMKLLESRWNKPIAVIIPSVLFASLHLLNGMNSIDVILLFVAGTTVGIMFSLVTYHKDTVWNSVIIHTIWNMFILGIFEFSTVKSSDSIINYVIEANNVFITGGEFGIEAALPAIIAYSLIIVISFIFKPKAKDNYKTTP